MAGEYIYTLEDLSKSFGPKKRSAKKSRKPSPT